ncbi:predicted protein [Sclerotinia sclerotiorum 1980 UF-70]|uniref:Uncharacterized protein n=1 Tax=Sclerotinia sclerotiorum (strain ATCC 18683 / 1980 / Ss-1) TaxID=665079 RepID=A7EK63_SCLS1|nr:predicted protein [Sclerotinia sclerotiorum 1980 UF-70]EDO03229.1 predicted protein [Sclerotinia sclerotiorum 1980 UF-70]
MSKVLSRWDAKTDGRDFFQLPKASTLVRRRNCLKNSIQHWLVLFTLLRYQISMVHLSSSMRGFAVNQLPFQNMD